MVSHAMKFDALIVIDVEILGLSNGEHSVVLEEADISDLVLGLELHDKVFMFPFKHGKVSFFTTEKDVLAISGH